MKKNYRVLKYLAAGVVAAFLFVNMGPLAPMLIARADGGPSVSLTAPVTLPGAPATVSGSGFTPGETVHVNFGTHSVDVVADSGGSISGVTLPIPTVPASLQFASAFGVTSGHWGLGYLWVTGYAPAVSPSTWYVLPGQALTFTGSGFAPNESIQLAYDGTTLGTASTTAGGTFTLGTITLPLSLHNTTATVTVTGSVSGMPTSMTLTIGQLYPSITPSAWYTAPGSIISVSGGGFAPNEGIAIAAGSSHASTTADASGAFTIGSFALPASGGGSVSLSATGAISGAATTVNIALSSLTPWLTFSTYWAQGGSALTIFGNGFAGGEGVSLTSGTQNLGSTTATSGGSFTFAGVVPFAPSGPVTISATGATSGAVGSGSMQVAPVYTSFTLGSYAVQRGHAIEFIGSGYLPNEPVQITTSTTGTTIVHTITASPAGTFDDSGYIVPASTTPGNMTVTAKGTHSFDEKSITLYVGE